MSESEQGNRALVVCAHPDDVDINAAGILSEWADAGTEITLLVVTSGDAGGVGGIDRSAIPEIRRSEQRAAAAIVGISEVRFLEGYRDGDVSVTNSLVRDISRVVRQIRPQRLMAMSPERDWSNISQGHPDHLAVGEATVRAFYPFARNPHAFPELLDEEGLEDWIVDELWLQAPPNPTTVVDITRFLDRKVRAVLAHESQFDDPVGAATMLRQWIGNSGARFGLGEGRAAEAFTVVHGRR